MKTRKISRSIRIYLFDGNELNQMLDASQQCFNEALIGGRLILRRRNELFAKCLGEHLNQCLLQNANIFDRYLPPGINWGRNECCEIRIKYNESGTRDLCQTSVVALTFGQRIAELKRIH